MPRGVFQMKAIKWRALDVSSIEAVYAELDREGDILIRQYKATTRTWKRQPVFWKAVGRSMYKAGVRVYTDDWIYQLVDYGARKKGWWIPKSASPKRRLSFRSGYRAKTTPRVIGSHGGGASGPWVHTYKRIWHKAHTPREFTAEILKRRAAPFAKNIQAAIVKGFLRGLKR